MNVPPLAIVIGSISFALLAISLLWLKSATIDRRPLKARQAELSRRSHQQSIEVNERHKDYENMAQDLVASMYMFVNVLEHAKSRLHISLSITGETFQPTDSKEIIMGDKYITTGQVGAVGPSAHAHDMTFNQIWSQVEGTIDLSRLAGELALLRQAMKKEATEPEQDVAIGAVATAEQAAKSGNGPKALESLKSTGKWALSVAEKIGVGVATAAIKSALGM